MHTNKTMSMSHRLKMQSAEREIEKKQNIWAEGTGGTEGTIAPQVMTGIEAKPSPTKDFGATTCPPEVLKLPTALKKKSRSKTIAPSVSTMCTKQEKKE